MKRKSKKTYQKPEMVTYKIDNEISLVMMTDEDNAPGGPGRTAPSTQSEPLQQNNFESNPFEESK
nr:hypothetical protein [uncultured Carboxylicivirga sp.]